jgi:hypothetical protein
MASPTFLVGDLIQQREPTIFRGLVALSCYEKSDDEKIGFYVFTLRKGK